MRGSGSSSRAVALWVAMVLAATGCQMLSPARPTARAVLRVAPLGVATGLVQLDMGKLRAAWGTRSLKTVEVVPTSASVPATVRLTVRGPGMSETSASVPFEEPQTAGAPLATLTLAVPAGKNRVFVLEGLNADGQPVRRIMAPAAVVGGDPVDLDVSFLSDAVARVLDHLISDPALTTAEAEAWEGLEGASLDAAQRVGTAPDQAGIVASLATTDLVAALTAHIDAIVGYDETANTFSVLDPGRFRARLLANLLRLDGAAVLTAAADPRLAVAPTGAVTVKVVDAAGTPVPGAAAAIYDPYRPVGSPKSVGQLDFFNVVSGTWTVVGAFDGKVAYGTVTVVDDAPTGPVTVMLADTLPAPSPTPTPVATPTPASADLEIYTDTPAWSFVDTVDGVFHDFNSVTDFQTHLLSNSGLAAIELDVTTPDAGDPAVTAGKAFMAMGNAAFDARPYEALEVWVRGLSPGSQVVGGFLDSAGASFGVPLTNAVGGTYQKLRYDVNAVSGGAPAGIKGFVLRYSGTTATKLYVDDVRFVYPGSPGYVPPAPPTAYEDDAAEAGWTIDDPTSTTTLDLAGAPVDTGTSAIRVEGGVNVTGYLRFSAPGLDFKDTKGVELRMNSVIGTANFNAQFIDGSGVALGSPIPITIAAGYATQSVTFSAGGLSVLDIGNVRGIRFEVPPSSTYAVDGVKWSAK